MDHELVFEICSSAVFKTLLITIIYLKASKCLNIRLTQIYETSVEQKYNGLCWRLADSNYFHTQKSIPCTNIRLRVEPVHVYVYVFVYPFKYSVNEAETLIK